MNGKDKRRSQLQTLKSNIEFDWESVRRRIAVVSAALSGQDEASPETLQRVWARRAEHLAQVPAPPDESEQMELALLRLGREVYGVDARYIFDVRPVEPRSVTLVPRVPGWVAGVVNLRGRIFSVIDLPRFWGLTDGADRAAARYLVVVETPGMEGALLADEVLPLERVPVNRIQDATGVVRGIRPEHLRGLADRANGDTLVILDLRALLADPQLIVHEEIV